jgi:hypothetical protein
VWAMERWILIDRASRWGGIDGWRCIILITSSEESNQFSDFRAIQANDPQYDSHRNALKTTSPSSLERPFPPLPSIPATTTSSPAPLALFLPFLPKASAFMFDSLPCELASTGVLVSSTKEADPSACFINLEWKLEEDGSS